MFISKKTLAKPLSSQDQSSIPFSDLVAHADKTRLTELFYVMRDRGCHNAEVLAQFTDAGAVFRFRSAANVGNHFRAAAGDQAQENF